MSTPLHLACNLNNLEIVNMLLELDEKLAEKADKDGLTPLHLASMRSSAAILNEFLEKAPRSFDILSPQDETVFHLAAKHNNTEAFIFMAEISGISKLLNHLDEYGNTVLHVAAFSCCYPVSFFFLIYITYFLSLYMTVLLVVLLKN